MQTQRKYSVGGYRGPKQSDNAHKFNRYGMTADELALYLADKARAANDNKRG